MTRDRDRRRAIFSPIRWADGALALLDQTRLPADEVWLHCPTSRSVADAIRRLAVRGAPAIGVAAAFGLVLAVDASEPPTAPMPRRVRRRLRSCSPPRGRPRSTCAGRSTRAPRCSATVARATPPRSRSRRAPRLGATRCRPTTSPPTGAWASTARRSSRAGDRVLTHCNAGALATAGFGTALGVIPAAWRAGRLGDGLGRRDAPAAPGRAPDRLGARAPRHPVPPGHRQHRPAR